MSKLPRSSGDEMQAPVVDAPRHHDRGHYLPFVYAEGEAEVHRFLEQVIGADEQAALDGRADSPTA